MTKQTGLLIPLELAQKIADYLGTQPHNQVNPLLVGMSQCQTLDVNIPEQEVKETTEVKK